MDKVTFVFKSKGRICEISNAGIHQKALMFEYMITEGGNRIGFNRHTLHPIKVATDSYFEMARFIRFLLDNTDPNDYDNTAVEFLAISNPQTIA